jgi:membrane-bound serine protease (ClpP class)
MLHFINRVMNSIILTKPRNMCVIGGSRLWIFYVLVTFLMPIKVCFASDSGSDSTQRVYVIPIRDEINPGMVRQVAAGMTEAEQLGADLIIVHMNTYGGLVDAADSIRTRFLNSSIPVVSFIDNNAASAGALISISCEKIFMREGANIGAATVVNQNAEALPDKYQSYMRSMMRSSAEKRGRDPLVAEAMVDPRTYIPGIIDSGRVLTFTTSEAIKNNYCEGEAESINEVLKLMNMEDAVVSKYIPTPIERVIGFLVNPAISGVLLLIIMGGIYYELQSPGIGFPLMASLLAATLYFAPLYLEGMAANWEILLAVVGFILILVEIFVLPGFGIAGAAGLLFLIFGFTFSMIGNDGFDFTFVPRADIVQALILVLASIFLGIFVSFFLAKLMLKTTRFGRLILTEELSSKDGFVSADTSLHLLVGKSGMTSSDLRPSGKVIIENRSYNASADRGFIERNTEVEVLRFDGITVWVKEKK